LIGLNVVCLRAQLMQLHYYNYFAHSCPFISASFLEVAALNVKRKGCDNR